VEQVDLLDILYGIEMSLATDEADEVVAARVL
jgi:hypothetical protein